MTFHFKPSAFHNAQACAIGNAVVEWPSSGMPQSVVIDNGPGHYRASNKVEKLFSNICAVYEGLSAAEPVATEERSTALMTMPKVSGLRQITTASRRDAHLVGRGAK